MAWPALSDILQRVRTGINEAAAGIWSDTELKRLINDGERDIAAKALCIDNVDSVTSTASSRIVPFSGVKVKRVEYTGATKPLGLQKITPLQMGRLPLNGIYPQYWFPWATTVGQCIVLDPKPTATTYALNLYVADYPVCEMYADADVPQIPEEFHLLLIDYAVYMALFKQKKWGQAANVYQGYINQINILRPKYVDVQVDSSDDFKVPDAIEYKQAG